MGYRTPNIDRIAKEGMMFTDSYGEQSCTAGRSSFITGQSVYRTGLSKVGIPAAPVGMTDKIVTIAALLKEQGYATGQFGKNHLGDLNTCCRPTTASTSSSATSTTSTPRKSRRWTTIRPKRTSRSSRSNSVRAASSIPGRPTRTTRRWSRAGAGSASRRSRTPGRSTRSGWRPATTSSSTAAKDFIKRQHEDGKPFFVWLNTTHMHLFTHTKPKSLGQAGRWQSPYHDTMIDHDKNVGEMLDLLDELGIADDTFVMYSTDNGPHRNSWPDGGMTPFRSEKNTNWEGAFRVPLLVRWPGKIKAGSVANGIVQHHDWLPTFLAMAGAPDVVEKLKKGYKAIGRTYKNHIDGFNLLPYLTGETEGEPAQLLLLLQRRRRRARACASTTGRSCSWSSGLPGHDGGLGASRSRGCGCPRSSTCGPTPTSSRTSPRTRTTTWFLHNAYFIYVAQAAAAKFAETFKEFPAVQKPNTFTIDDAMAKMSEAASGANH